jgi:hypothetical protein
MRVPLRGRLRLAALVAVVIAAAAAGIAYASIPDSGGVIHGCYKIAGGALRVIDPATGSCLNSETSIAWNQTGPTGATGPTGPRGPSDAYLASDGGTTIGSGPTTLVSLALPAGNYTLIAKTGVYNRFNADIVDCLLKSGTTVLDEDEVRIDGLGNPGNDDNEFMDLIGTVSLSGPGTISVDCTSFNSESENTQLLATQVATLHP